ncbi:MAG: hypothetical protein QXH97_00255 [Candidatus Bathyarchaeia archaeon]
MLSSLIGSITSAISQLGATLSSILNTIVNTISSVISSVIQGLQSIGSQIINTFVSSFSTLQAFFESVFANITNNLLAIGAAIQGFVNAVFETGNRIAQWLKSLVDALVNFFKDPIGNIVKALSDAWNALLTVFDPIIKPIKDFFEGVFKGIQDFLSNPIGFIVARLTEFWNLFVELTRPLWVPIKDFIDSLAKGIQAFLSDPIGFITERVTDLWNSFVELTKPIWEPFKTVIDSIYSGLRDFFSDPLGFIAARLSEVWNSFVEFTRPIWEPIKGFFDSITNALKPITDFFTDAAAKIGKFILEDIPRFFSEDVPRFFTQDLPKYLITIGEAVLNGLRTIGNAIYQAFLFLGELIMRGVTALFDIGRQIFGSLAASLISEATKGMAEAIKPSSPPPEIKEFINTYLKSLETTVLDKVKELSRHEQVTERAIATALAAAGTLITIYSLALLPGQIADQIHPFKNTEWRKYVKGVIDNLGGFFIMSSFSATLTFFGIHPVLRRFWYKLFRPILPGPDTLTLMYFRKTIDQQYFMGHMAELGLPDTLISGFIDVNANIPTPLQLIRMVGKGLITEDEALKQLEKAGWIGVRGFVSPSQIYQATLDTPTTAEVIRLYLRAVYKREEAEKLLLANGRDPKYFDNIVEASQDLPPVESLFDAWWRGHLKPEEFKYLLLAHGRHPKYVDVETKAKYKIPTPQELVTMVIREVIEPDQFKKLVLAQGYQPAEVIKEVLGEPLITVTLEGRRAQGDWADAFFEMHWRLPSPENIFEFYNRAVAGLITVAGTPIKIDDETARKEVFAWMALHDYKPHIRELTGYLKNLTGISKLSVEDVKLVDSLRYRILTRIESRFVRRWGLIAEDEYMRLGKAQGIDPYLKIKAIDGSERTMLEALAHAEFLQDLLEERTLLRTQIIAAYQEGFDLKLSILDPIDKKTIETSTLVIEDALKALRFRPEEIDWLKAVARIRRLIDIRKDSLRALADDYVAGATTLEEFTKGVAELIEDQEVRDIFIKNQIAKRMRTRVKRMLTRLDREILREADTVLRLYENGFASKQTVEKILDELIDKDVLLKEEKDILLSISERRRKRELTELALRALGKQVSRGLLSPEEFVAKAQGMGVDGEFAKYYAEALIAYHTLSVAQLLSYADEVAIPMDMLVKKLRTLGVPEDEQRIILEVARRRPIADEIRTVANLILSAARDMDTTSKEALDVLKGLGMSDEEIRLRQKIIDTILTMGQKKQIRRTLDVLLREQYEGLAKGVDYRLIKLEDYLRAYEVLGYPRTLAIAKAQEIIAATKHELIQGWAIPR